MRESTTPALVTVDHRKNVTNLVTDWAAEHPDDVVFRRKNESQTWDDVTISEFQQEVVALAKGLVAAGIGVGDRVAVMSRTRYEWTLIDIAVMFAGGVTVPVYETSSAEQAAWILEDSGAKALFIEADDTLAERPTSFPQDMVWVIEADGINRVVQGGLGVNDEEIRTRCAAVDLDSPATIIYTSGTTGRPKGCVLTHGNFYVLTLNTVARLKEIIAVDGKSTLLFLPLAHVFARFIQMLVLAARVPMGHTPNIADVVADLDTYKPTYILSVPRVFEKIYNSAEQKAQASGRVRIFHLAVKVAIAYSRALESGSPSVALRLQHALFDRLVYSKLRTVMGGELEFAVSGGGPLGERLGHFFRGMGVTILEGYGLTESTAPTCVNVPERVRVGTVGPQLPSNSVRIADDGEILLKGPHIFHRYHNNPTATQEAFQDGWFLTGDFGSLDDDGYLRITGRKKEIIVTAGGKNVVPALLEDRLRAHPLVSQCLVVGDGRPFIAAIITLDPDMLPIWLPNHGLPDMDVAHARTNEKVMEALQQAIDRVNQSVSKAESIKSFVVLEEDFTVKSGHLTPSIKLKRNSILRDYATDIDALYTRRK